MLPSLSYFVITAPNNGSQKRISALHFLALVDVKAHWFRRWLHGNYSRATVIGRLKDRFR